jgi:hypothetical protein
MSLDNAPKDKMLRTPPAKKGWHFPSDGIYFAEFIEAETIEEAEALYHKIKRVIGSAAQDLPAGPSTAVASQAEDKDVQ